MTPRKSGEAHLSHVLLSGSPNDDSLRDAMSGVARYKDAEECDTGVQFKRVGAARVDRQEMPGRLAGVEFRDAADRCEFGIGQPSRRRDYNKHVPVRIEATRRAVGPESRRAVQDDVAIRRHRWTGKQARVTE